MILQLVWSFQSILYVLLHVDIWWHLMTFAYFFRAGKCQPELQAESGTWWRRSFQRLTSAPGWTGFLLASCVDWILPWGWRPRVDASFCFVFTRAACLLNLPYWMTQAWLDMTYTYLYYIYITCIFLSAKISVFSAETALTIHHAEVVRSHKDVLARPKFPKKCEMSCERAIYIVDLCLSSFSWCFFRMNWFVQLFIWLDSVFILSMDARQSRLYSMIIRAAPEGVWTVWCHLKKHAFAAAFFSQPKGVFFWSQTVLFPTARVRDSSSQMFWYRAFWQWIKACFTQPIQIVKFEPVGSARFNRFHPEVTVDVEQKYRCQNSIDHRNMFDWTKMIFLDASHASVWFCGLTNLTFVSQRNLFQYLASSQTYACNIQARAYHSYHVRGMTYLKKIMYKDTLLPETKHKFQSF